MFSISMTVGSFLASLLDVLTTLIVVEWAVSWLVVFRVMSESSPFFRAVKKPVRPDP